MRNIPIYKNEIDLGLKNVIETNCSISYNSLVTVDTSPNIEIVKSIPAIQRATAENKGQLDLFYFKDIMATVCWNLNDDVITAYEMYCARHSAEDKQVNIGHNHKEIIGHNTGQYLVDTEGKVISEDTPIDELPEKFHLVSSSVIYRYWKDKDYMDKINNIIQEIESDDNKWHVSLEALFSDFDYAVESEDSSYTIVPRNSETSFLTKHLRCYGGTGVFKNKRIGRVLKNIIFSGKGLTKIPANVESIILKEDTKFSTAKQKFFLDIGYLQSSENFSEEKKMDEKNEVELLQKELTQTKELLTKTLEDKNSLELENKKLISDLEKFNNELEEANKKLAEIETQNKIISRKSDLVTKLGLEDNEASNLVTILLSLSDDDFAKFLEISKKGVNKLEVKPVDNSGSQNANIDVLENGNVDVSNSSVVLQVKDENRNEIVRNSIVEHYNKIKGKKISS